MNKLVRIRVWDLPTRVFHWALALNVVASVGCAKAGWMEWHMRLGYVALTLLLFRLLWGLVGGRWSRFGAMLFTPAAIWRHLRGRGDPGHGVGHSPVGVLSVAAMLAVLIAQAATGLVADDEILTQGPLVALVSGATSLAATAWHKQWGQWLIYALVALHLLAIALYHWRGRPLARAMVNGDKCLPPGTPASTDDGGRRALALVVLALAAGLVTWIVRLGAPGG